MTLLSKKKKKNKSIIGRGVLPPRFICSLYLKCCLNNFWNVKIIVKKYLPIDPGIICVHKVISWINDIFCGLGKKIKFDAKIRFFTRQFYLFYTAHRKCRFPVKQMWICIQEILFQNFSIFQNVFFKYRVHMHPGVKVDFTVLSTIPDGKNL